MSQHSPQPGTAATPIEALPPPPGTTTTVSSSWRGTAIVLAAALALIVVLVATGPLWAPLVPRAGAPEHGMEQELAARVERVAASQSDLQRRTQQDAAASKAALQQIEQRLDALATRPGVAVDDFADMRRRSAALDTKIANLSTRIDGVDKALQTQPAHDSTEGALAIVLLQIREAVAAGQPFQAGYDTLTVLARGHPDLAKAALPLAGPAKTGVPTLAMLSDRLRSLAQLHENAEATPTPTHL